MSTDNQAAGRCIYAAGDEEIRNWFHRQWTMWPDRADPGRTTNGSLHYGGVLAYRDEHGKDPEMSEEFGIHVRIMDGFNKDN